MLIHKLILTIIITCFLFSNAFANEQDERLCECITALNEIEDNIKENQTHLIPDLVKGLRGLIMMHYKAEANCKTSGKVSDLLKCRYFGLNINEILVILDAYQGNLPKDPYYDIVNCNAGIIYYSNMIEKKYGQSKSYNILFEYGEKWGRSISRIRYLFRSCQDIKFSKLNFDSIKLLKEINRLSLEKKEEHLDHWCEVCEHYGFQLRDLIKIAE